MPNSKKIGKLKHDESSMFSYRRIKAKGKYYLAKEWWDPIFRKKCTISI